jgi:hypothetical protein
MKLDSFLARLKGVRRSGHGYVALCPAHADHKPSLSITLAVDRILIHCFVGCCVELICEALGVRLTELFGPGAIRLDDSHWTDPERRNYALRLWRRSRFAVNTVVENYLRSRGITMQVPRALRLIALLPHCEYGWPFPALVAGLQDAEGAFAPVSVTWLCADGSSKAPVEPARKIYGPFCVSALRLAPPAETLALCEGIETALSVQQATGTATWATLGTSNLESVELPDLVRDVVIAADGDEAGIRAANRAAQRLLSEGRHVRIARPIGGRDFNEMRV